MAAIATVSPVIYRLVLHTAAAGNELDQPTRNRMGAAEAMGRLVRAHVTADTNE